VADDPAEVTRTTCEAVTPAGTWQVAADGVGDGRGDGLGAGLLEVEGFALDLVAEGRCEGFGLARAVDPGRVVVVVVVVVVGEGVAAVVVEAVEVGLAVVVGGAACWSAPQPAAARSPRAVAAARTAVGTVRLRVRLIGRSAGGRGCSTGRPSAAPAT